MASRNANAGVGGSGARQQIQCLSKNVAAVNSQTSSSSQAAALLDGSYAAALVERVILRPRPARRETHMGGGLYLIVQPSGYISFAVRFRLRGRCHKFTLPKNLTLADACAAAAAAMREVKQGYDPGDAKREARKVRRRLGKRRFRYFEKLLRDVEAVGANNLPPALIERVRIARALFEEVCASRRSLPARGTP
jgi:Arm DNA-binding domain